MRPCPYRSANHYCVQTSWDSHPCLIYNPSSPPSAASWIWITATAAPHDQHVGEHRLREVEGPARQECRDRPAEERTSRARGAACGCRRRRKRAASARAAGCRVARGVGGRWAL